MTAVAPGKRRLDRWLDARLGEELLAKLESLPTQRNEYGFDPFGFHRDQARWAGLIARFLYRDYFRAEAFGLANIPRGRVLLVSNHSGQLPFDAVCIAGACLCDLDPPRLPRAMVERFVPTLPFVSYLFPRWGQITGTPENCARLLEAEEAILVFPEGAKGIAKPYSQRYQLQEFGLGFLRLALATRTPVVPVAVIGAEEQMPSLNLRPLAQLLGWPSLPIVPYPPFLPLLPLPTKYRIYFGEPLHLTGDPDDEDEVLAEKVRLVRNRIQSMVREGLGERQHVFW